MTSDGRGGLEDGTERGTERRTGLESGTGITGEVLVVLSTGLSRRLSAGLPRAFRLRPSLMVAWTLCLGTRKTEEGVLEDEGACF